MTVHVADFAARYPHVTLPAWLHDVDTVHKPADYARGETHAFVLAIHWAMEEEAWIPRVINVETRARELCREWGAPMPPPTYRRRYRTVGLSRADEIVGVTFGGEPFTETAPGVWESPED